MPGRVQREQREHTRIPGAHPLSLHVHGLVRNVETVTRGAQIRTRAASETFSGNILPNRMIEHPVQLRLQTLHRHVRPHPVRRILNDPIPRPKIFLPRFHEKSLDALQKHRPLLRQGAQQNPTPQIEAQHIRSRFVRRAAADRRTETRGIGPVTRHRNHRSPIPPVRKIRIAELRPVEHQTQKIETPCIARPHAPQNLIFRLRFLLQNAIPAEPKQRLGMRKKHLLGRLLRVATVPHHFIRRLDL